MAKLKKNKPEYYNILSTVKVRFRFIDKDVVLESWSELIHLDQNKNFKSPVDCTFKLSGKPLKEKMIKVLEKLYNEKVILDHGMKVGTELANVLSGGDTTPDKLLTEDNLYQLELTSFMNLIETDQTKDRIRHTLATGKPLVN